jgi:hypothetical protein
LFGCVYGDGCLQCYALDLDLPVSVGTGLYFDIKEPRENLRLRFFTLRLLKPEPGRIELPLVAGFYGTT